MCRVMHWVTIGIFADFVVRFVAGAQVRAVRLACVDQQQAMMLCVSICARACVRMRLLLAAPKDVFLHTS